MKANAKSVVSVGLAVLALVGVVGGGVMAGDVAIQRAEPTIHFLCEVDLAENGDHLDGILDCEKSSVTQPPGTTATRPAPTATQPAPTSTAIAATQTPIPATATPSAPAPATATFTPAPAVVEFPFGPFHIEAPGAMSSDYWTGGFMDLKDPNDLSPLANAYANDLHVLVHLTGGRSNFQNPDGSFNLGMFQNVLNEWRNSGLEEYIDNGTIVGHLMIDEPQDTQGNWGGHAFKFSDMEAAAAYSKSIWPNMPAGAGTSPSWAMGSEGVSPGDPSPFVWSAFDFTSTPYASRKGNYLTFLNNELALAQQGGLKVFMSINVLHGGVTQGTAVTATDLRTWGSAFINDPRNCGLTMWKWDTSDNGEYFSSPDIAGVLAELNALVLARGGCP